jgi:hypothetical protein
LKNLKLKLLVYEYEQLECFAALLSAAAVDAMRVMVEKVREPLSRL